MKKRFISYLSQYRYNVAFYCLVIVAAILLNRYIIGIAFVQGPSMENTLTDKQVVWLYRWKPNIHNGDIIITNKNNPFDSNLIKRVISMEGQHLQIKNGTIWLDNKKLDEPYLKEQEWQSDMIDIIMPKNHAYILGDNRNQSRDSREIGCIPISDIIGKVIFIN